MAKWQAAYTLGQRIEFRRGSTADPWVGGRISKVTESGKLLVTLDDGGCWAADTKGDIRPAQGAPATPITGDTLHVGDPRLPAEPKRGRGRPARGEPSGTINVVVGGQRHGVRLAASERKAVERAAAAEMIPVSTLLRRVALVYANDPHARATIHGSAQWHA